MNRILLMGIVSGNPRVIVSKAGKTKAWVDLVTTEDETDPQSYERFTRRETHRLMFSGKLALDIQGLAISGQPLSVEGQLVYFRSGGVVRVTSATAPHAKTMSSPPKVKTPKKKALNQAQELSFISTPALSSVYEAR